MFNLYKPDMIMQGFVFLMLSEERKREELNKYKFKK